MPSSSSSPNNKQIPKKICTVEELERGLLKSRYQNQSKPPPMVQPQQQLQQQLPTGTNANLNQQPPYLFQVIVITCYLSTLLKYIDV